MKLNITKRTRISHGFMKIDRVTISLPNGKQFNREIIQKVDGVVILAVSTSGNVFLVKQPRAGIEILNSIELPAGLLMQGETPEDGAQRELSEETGCTLTEPLISLGSFVLDPATCTSVTHIFLALNVVKTKTLHLDYDEFITCINEHVIDVYTMLDRGIIMDANSIIALDRARKNVFNFL